MGERMRTFFFGVVLGAAIGAGIVELKGQGISSQPLAYVSADEVATALRKMGSKNGYSPVVDLDPYVVLAEHRTVTKNPASTASIHKNEAELYYVIEGSATLVTGRMPDQPSGGATQQIHKGDVLIIPENTPHWFSAVNEELSYISMHVPRSNSSASK
jgi:mannose-6-phosphate isomerase-like protein (cupin superfamily)